MMMPVMIGCDVDQHDGVAWASIALRWRGLARSCHPDAKLWQGSRHKTARMVHEDPMLMKMSMKILVVGEVA
jgi:hypothetical protein